MNVREVLTEAAALVDRGWTQGVTARDEAGDLVDSHTEAAVCWCAYGAIIRACGNKGLESELEIEAYDAATRRARARGFSGLVTYNDHPGRTQDEVSALLREAADA